MVRAFFAIREYFDNFPVRVIFVSPKINPATLESLEIQIKEVRDLAHELDWKTDFKLVCNDEFQKQIIEPLKSYQKIVADTSERVIGIGRDHAIGIHHPSYPTKGVVGSTGQGVHVAFRL